MSKRHTASRRRSYGRRQHELHERIDRVTERRRGERAWREAHEQLLEPLVYTDSSTFSLRLGFSD
jgi:hypothetical protein